MILNNLLFLKAKNINVIENAKANSLQIPYVLAPPDKIFKEIPTIIEQLKNDH